MLLPLEQFYCDTCGQLIERPKDGYVEWLSRYNEQRGIYINRGFRIVHHLPASPLANGGLTGCYEYQNESGRRDIQLGLFLGENKMAYILKYLDIGPFHEKDYKGPYVEDMREYVEFVRRITIPYYEEARMYWDIAIEDNFWGDPNELSLYNPNRLQALVERYGK